MSISPRTIVISIVALLLLTFHTGLASAASGLSHTYLGNYPKAREHGWSNNAQGVADNDSSAWFFSQETRLLRFPYWFDLNTGINPDSPPVGVTTAKMPSQLTNAGYNHYGDLDYYRGYLFVPVTGAASPAIAVFNASNLAYISHQVLNGQQGAGWLAINPVDGKLWTSDNIISDRYASGEGPLFHYTVDWSALNVNRVLKLTLQARGPILKAGGIAQRLNDMQGGVFSPSGRLYLSSGYCDAHHSPEGIGLYDGAGSQLVRSTNGSGSFNLEWHTAWQCIGGQEPEGITWWPTSSPTWPGINGELHAIMIDNEGTDDFYFKHYDVV